jgi:hypothetical protein
MSGVSGLWAASNGLEGLPAESLPATQMLIDTGIFHMIKITEVVVGLMLVFNCFAALAAIFLAPVSIGVLVFNLSAESLPTGAIPTTIFLVGLNVYLGYVYWDKYKALFIRKS